MHVIKDEKRGGNFIARYEVRNQIYSASAKLEGVITGDTASEKLGSEA